MALIRPSIDLRQFSFSKEGSTYNEKKQKCICVVSAVCVLCHSKGAVPCASVEAPWTPYHMGGVGR